MMVYAMKEKSQFSCVDWKWPGDGINMTVSRERRVVLALYSTAPLSIIEKHHHHHHHHTNTHTHLYKTHTQEDILYTTTFVNINAEHLYAQQNVAACVYIEATTAAAANIEHD